ncbi:MAG: sulfatase-like hydrolase/transferase [Gemmatimonadota bacterium]|nr:sulfatase-like hydrolase/transferase [Gemmatimonadota bacterium]
MSKKYNILLMISDQHSKYHIGAYGDPLVRTPNLDQLAENGMRFTSAYCASPVCVPSRMSFMTCRTPSANRVWNNNHLLHSGIPTWAHAMGLAGYETSLIGRMHFNGHDQRHGFENRPLGEYGAIHPGANRRGAPLFKSISTATTGQNRTAVEIAGRGYGSYHVFDEMVAERTRAYLRDKAKNPGNRPFAAVAGFLLPHCPFIAHKELFDYYYDRVDIPQHTPNEPGPIRKFKQIRGLYPPLDEERIRVARAAYFGMCEYLDLQIGHILQTLRETGLDRNTLVIYCSDHGEMAGEHGCWWKSSYYEGSVGVPLIASLPGVIAPNAESDQICNLMDIGPTLLDMADGNPMPDIHGYSLWSLLTGQGSGDHPNETYSEHLGQEGIPSRMIRTGPWKCYTYHDNTAPVLYNLEDDPDEMRDLGSDSNYEHIRNHLLSRIFEHWDPEDVLRESADIDRDIRLITRWGQAIQPTLPDTVAVPDDAEDIECR